MTEAQEDKGTRKNTWEVILDILEEGEYIEDEGGERPRRGDITRETTLDDLEFDSLDKVEFTMELEEKLGITIPDEDLTEKKDGKEVSRFNNLGEFDDYLSGKTAA